jgi:hypothetical protein
MTSPKAGRNLPRKRTERFVTEDRAIVTPTELPELVSLDGRETLDGLPRIAIRNVVYFPTRKERDAFLQGGARWQVKVGNQVFFGTEHIVYLS